MLHLGNCRVHIYNLDELILCALPFHDTETFVRIVQLLDLGFGSADAFSIALPLLLASSRPSLVIFLF